MELESTIISGRLQRKYRPILFLMKKTILIWMCYFSNRLLFILFWSLYFYFNFPFIICVQSYSISMIEYLYLFSSRAQKLISDLMSQIKGLKKCWMIDAVRRKKNKWSQSQTFQFLFQSGWNLWDLMCLSYTK